VRTKFDIYIFISDVHVFQFYLVHVLCFIFYNVYLFTYIVVLHDVNNNNVVSRLTVTGRMPLVEQELLNYWAFQNTRVHLRFLVGFVLPNL
jgi:hypothetical protein